MMTRTMVIVCVGRSCGSSLLTFSVSSLGEQHVRRMVQGEGRMDSATGMRAHRFVKSQRILTYRQVALIVKTGAPRKASRLGRFLVNFTINFQIPIGGGMPECGLRCGNYITHLVSFPQQLRCFGSS